MGIYIQSNGYICMLVSNAGSSTDFRDTFPKLFSGTSFHECDFKFCFTLYPTDITLCLWSGFIYPKIGRFVEQRSGNQRTYCPTANRTERNQVYSLTSDRRLRRCRLRVLRSHRIQPAKSPQDTSRQVLLCHKNTFKIHQLLSLLSFQKLVREHF